MDLAFAAALAVLAAAEDDTVYRKRTRIDFREGDAIVGELSRPTGTVVVARPQSRFRVKIWVRTNFDSEVLQSHHQL